MRTRVLLLGLLGAVCVSTVAAAGDMPAKVKQIFADRIGHWASTTTWNGTTDRSVLTNTWAMDKRSILCKWTMLQSDGLFDATEIISWDSAKDAVVVHGTSTRGDYWISTYDKQAGNIWSGHATGMWNGKPWESPIKIEWSENGWRYEDTTEGKPFVSVGKRVEVAATATARDHMKAMKGFLGTWKVTRPGPEYLANSPKLKQFVGKPMTRTIVYRWTADRTAQIEQHAVDFDGKFTIKSTALRGWDPTAGAIRGYMFTSAGGKWIENWRQDGDQWIMDYQGVNLEGDSGSGQICFKFNGPDKMDVTERNVLYAGKPQPDSTFTSKRVAAPQRGKKKQ